MPKFLSVLLSLGAILIIIIFLVWRIASRRHTLPCPSWLHWMVERDNPFTKTNRASVIIDHLGLQPGMHVLDVGCGPGRLTIPLARAVGPQGHVLAIDIQPGMLHRAEEKARAAGLTNIQFQQVGVGQGKLEPACYDRALLVTVLGEIPERENALRELFTTLKPGGIVSVTEVIFDPHFQPRSTVRALATTVGFREKDCFGQRFAYTLHLEKPAPPHQPIATSNL